MAPTATKKAPIAKKPAAHPTFLSMIQECVKAHPEEARAGVSRPTLKKFLAEKYKLDMSSAANVTNLNNAIKRGAEKGDLNLPKGIGGRVKVPAKKSASAGKENVAPKKMAAKAPVAKKASAAAAPAKKPAAKKPVAAPKPAKTTAAPPKKKVAAPAAKKTASGTKKVPAAKAVATKAKAKKPVAQKKKAVAKK